MEFVSECLKPGFNDLPTDPDGGNEERMADRREREQRQRERGESGSRGSMSERIHPPMNSPQAEYRYPDGDESESRPDEEERNPLAS